MSFALTAIQHQKTRIQSKSVLFQFILNELITSYHEVFTIKQLSSNLEQDLNYQTFNTLKSKLLKLAGSERKHGRLFSWSEQDGILSRLKNYCTDFLLQTEKNNLKISKMSLSINQAFLNCVQSVDAIFLAEEGSEKAKHLLNKILNKMIKEIERFSKLTAKVIQQFSDDENVLFFMLRHQPDLDKLYGPLFVFKLFKKMFPKGIKQASLFLSDQYKMRGFDHLIPTIQKKISELENI